MTNQTYNPTDNLIILLYSQGPNFSNYLLLNV